jgi:hypothetical protein
MRGSISGLDAYFEAPLTASGPSGKRYMESGASNSLIICNRGKAQILFSDGENTMVRTLKQIVTTALSILLIFPAASSATPGQQVAPTGYSGQGAPLAAQELQQLVAPIALYPDALVARS